MSKLSLREIAQSQLDSTPVIDGQLIVCLDTGNAYRDTATAHVKIGSDLEVVSDLPLAPLAEKLYYLKPDKLYVFLGGNWTLLNDKTIYLDEAIAKLPAGDSTSLNDDVEIITQDTDITQSHYYRRKLVVLWEYIKTKAQDFFAAKNHQHGKADITDFPTSMPASDVYPWAKAATKPSYTKAEVGLGEVDNTADADKTVKRATTAGTADSANSVAWENVKDKPTTFPVEAHNHDDRYYTEAEVDGKLSGKSNTDHTHDLSELISALSIGSSTTLNDTVQIITQDTDTANQKYYRRPLTVLWDYIKSKADSVYSAIGHNHKIQNLEDYTTRVYDATNVRPADTVLASPQDKDGIATFRKLDKNDVGLENVDNTADKNKNVATARGISVGDPVLATGVENSEITGKMNDNKSLGTTAANAGVWGLRNALDFRWYDTHWQIGNLRSGSTPSAGFGFAFKDEGENSFSLKARILTDGTYEGNISGNAATAGTANTLSGFSPRSSQNWGVQTGTFIHGEGEGTGGDFAFRRDCPNAGQVSMVLDGRFYQNEGQYMCLDTNNYSGYALPLSGGTISGALNFANGTWNLVGDDAYMGDHNIGGSFCIMGANDTTRLALVNKDNQGDYALVEYGGGNLNFNKKLGANITGHADGDLSLGGGTMTGNITFSDIGNTNTSNKISWNGSTDGADIYYQTTAGDQGNLVLNLRDDSNCYLRIAKNGTFKSYFSPDDGNFHGNVNGTADKANSVDWSKVQNKPSSYPPSSHTHNYAGSASAGGAAISANALNPTVTLTGGDGNTTGYRLIGQVSIGQWGNYRCVMLVNSRHQGAGLVTVTIGNNTNSITQNNAYAEIKYWGPTSSGSVISSSSYQVYISSDGKIGYLFWQYYDYSPCVVRVLGSDFTISNGTWMTGIGSGYGKCVATTQINAASTAEVADVATVGVRDYNDGNRTIKIGYAGAGLTADNLTHIAGYTDNGTKIKDVSKDVLKSWIGLGNYLPLSGGTMSGQIIKSTGGSWIGDRDRAAIKSGYPGDWSYGAVAGMATKNGYWTIGNLGGNESLIFNYSTDANYNAGNNSTAQVYLPAQAGTIITSATIGSQTVNRAEYLSNDAAYMRMHWNGQGGQPTWLWGGNDASNMYVWNPSNFSVNYANSAGNGVVASGYNYVRFGDGTQMCWGQQDIADTGTTITFAVAFSSIPAVVNSGTEDIDDVFFVHNITTTNFVADKKGWYSGNNTWIAIGRWK